MNDTGSEPAVAVSPAEPAQQARGGWWPLVAVLLAVFMLMLDSTVVSVALPAMQTDLHADLTDLQWVMNAYILALAAVQLTGGAIADRVGRRPVFLVGVVVFTLSSLACGLAWDVAFLVTARVVQGVAGACMFTTSLALIGQCYTGRERGIAMGVRGTIAGVAVVLGPVVGGALVNGLDWRWIFFLNVPIGVVALLIAMRVLPRDAREQGAPADGRGRLDLAGPALFAAFMILLVFVLLEGNDLGWSGGTVIGMSVAAVVALAAFLGVEARHPNPMLPLRLFRARTFTGTQIAAFVVQASIFGLFVYLSLYFQNYLGYTPLQAGLCFLPVVVPMLITSPLAGSLMDRVPRQWLVGGGLVLLAAGLFLLVGPRTDSTWLHLLPGLIVCGLACGLTLPTIGSLALEVEDPRLFGVASGVNNTVVQLGLAVGIGAYGAIYGVFATPAAGPLGVITGFNTMFAVAAGVAVVGVVATALLVREPRTASRTGS